MTDVSYQAPKAQSRKEHLTIVSSPAQELFST